MPSEFETLAKRFHEAEFSENSVQLTDSLTKITWTPSSTLLFGDLQGKLHHVKVSNCEPVKTDEITVSPGSRITDVATNLSGNLFASTSFASEEIHLGDIDKDNGTFGGNVSSIPCSEKALCVSFLEDQRSRQCLLLTGARKAIRVHDVESGGVFRSLQSKSIFTSLYSWSGCMLMSGTSDGEVALWDIRRPQVIATFGTRVAGSGRALFSVDVGARLLALGSTDGNVEFYDIGARKLIVRKKVAEGAVGCLDFSRKSRFLSVADNEMLRMINLNDFSTSPMPFPSKSMAEINRVTEIRWHPSECLVATRSTDKKLRIFKPIIREEMKH